MEAAAAPHDVGYSRRIAATGFHPLDGDRFLRDQEGVDEDGRRIYDMRHTRLTKWLNDGIPPAQVAYRVGTCIPVLLAFYAGCIEGQLPDIKRRMEAQGDLPELSEAE